MATTGIRWGLQLALVAHIWITIDWSVGLFAALVSIRFELMDAVGE